MEQIVNWFMLLIIFVFDPLAIAMVVAANMAFAQIKGFKPKEEKKDYKVYKKPEASKEKIITKEVIKEIPIKERVKLPKGAKRWIKDAAIHAKRDNKIVPPDLDRFFED
jgi:hypothetical protein